MLLDLEMEIKGCHFFQSLFTIFLNLAQRKKEESVMYNAEQKVRGMTYQVLTTV